jgi:hypothetical protein
MSALSQEKVTEIQREIQEICTKHGVTLNTVMRTEIHVVPLSKDELEKESVSEKVDEVVA